MRYFQVTDAIILSVSGRDARRYLNSRLTNNIKTLADGEVVSAGLLTPQGKTQAVFQVLSLGQDQFFLICDGGDRAKVMAATRQFIVADRVVVEDQSDNLKIFHLFSPSPQQNLNSKTNGITRNEDAILIPRNRTENPGIDLLAPSERALQYVESLYPKSTELSADQARAHSFRSKIPTFPRDIQEESLFSIAGLDSAIAFNKGCYVGQEVIEKIDSHGKLPLQLLFIEHAGAIQLELEAPLDLRDIQDATRKRAIGRVVSYCYDKERDATYAYVEIKQQINISEFISVSVCGAVGWTPTPLIG